MLYLRFYVVFAFMFNIFCYEFTLCDVGTLCMYATSTVCMVVRYVLSVCVFAIYVSTFVYVCYVRMSARFATYVCYVMSVRCRCMCMCVCAMDVLYVCHVCVLRNVCMLCVCIRCVCYVCV